MPPVHCLRIPVRHIERWFTRHRDAFYCGDESAVRRQNANQTVRVDQRHVPLVASHIVEDERQSAVANQVFHPTTPAIHLPSATEPTTVAVTSHNATAASTTVSATIAAPKTASINCWRRS